MKTKQIIRCLLANTILCITALAPAVFGQGALTPPGAPAPTMKTLQQVEPRTPISSIPFTITSAGAYYLTANLTAIPSNPGISIYTNNVTLDLNGFTLQGVPTAGTAVGIWNASTNVTVRNGTITGWVNNGVYGLNTYNLLCEGLTISGIANSYGICCGRSGVIRNCAVQRTGGYGICATNCTITGCTVAAGNSDGIYACQSTVRDCTAAGNGDAGIYAVSSAVSGCVASGNTNYGIYAAARTVVENCQAQNNNSYGIFTSYSTVRGCSCYNNGGAGIDAWYSLIFNCQVKNNSAEGIYAWYSTISGCLVNDNTKSGIYASSYYGCRVIGNNCYDNNYGNNTNYACIYIDGSNCRIEANHVAASGYAGIRADAINETNLIIRNFVSGNGTNNYHLEVSQMVGPLITTYGTITSVNPWANFSHQ